MISMMLKYFKWIGECWEILYPYHQRITLVGNPGDLLSCIKETWHDGHINPVRIQIN
jgi:hypothetical protein